MAVIESPETLGIRPFHEFDEAQDTWPRGDRPAALRQAAEAFRERFKGQGQVRAIRTVDLVAAGYPTLFAFGGAARGLNPYISILNRLVVVQFDDFDGTLRTLAWEPTVPEGSQEAPFYEQMLERYGQLAEKLFATYYNTVESALSLCGLRPDDVDYIAFDHLHVQDVRILMGTDDRPGFFVRSRDLQRVQPLFAGGRARFFDDKIGWSVEAEGSWLLVRSGYLGPALRWLPLPYVSEKGYEKFIAIAQSIHALIRANDEIGDRMWNELLPPQLSAELDHANRHTTIGVAPSHSEQFAYTRVTDETLEAIARYFAICALT